MAIKVARKIRAHDVLEVLADLFVRHGPPEYLRSDNGPEFTAKLVRRWLGRVGVETLFIEPGSPYEAVGGILPPCELGAPKQNRRRRCIRVGRRMASRRVVV